MSAGACFQAQHTAQSQGINGNTDEKMLAGTVRRTGRPLVLENIQHLSTSAALQQAVPATQEAVKKSSGFLSKLLGLTSDRIAIPLTDPLPNVPQPSPVAPPSSAPPTESTTLPNGVKVVSEATYVSFPLFCHMPRARAANLNQI